MNPTPGLKGTANAMSLKIADQAPARCHQAQLQYLHLAFFRGVSRAAKPCPPLRWQPGSGLAESCPSSTTKFVLTSTCLPLSGNVFSLSVAPHIRDLSQAQARRPDNSWEKPVGSPGRPGVGFTFLPSPQTLVRCHTKEGPTNLIQGR